MDHTEVVTPAVDTSLGGSLDCSRAGGGVTSDGAVGGGGDDSDTDIVTDFLNSNCCTSEEGKGNCPTATAASNNTANANNGSGGANYYTNGHIAAQALHSGNTTAAKPNYCIPIIQTPGPIVAPHGSSGGGGGNNNNNNNRNYNQHHNSGSSSNMIPTINVTPHSPAPFTKYNNIFEDTLSQLQNIRESVVQMKNSSAHGQNGGGGYSNYGGYGMLQDAAMLSSSLPDLNGGSADASAPGTDAGGLVGASAFTRMSQLFAWRTPHQYLLHTSADRRRSWTAVDDLLAGGGGDGTNNSVSLSSLDSEEQETIRVAEQRRRATRNSTGGISTHSLNEAELARDFERIATKRTLAAEAANRITLQKSISTSSIIAKEDIKAIQRHLTDSEDENQSLLRSHTKAEVYDNVEKRRKRGSLFFRKKNKDKVKLKMSSAQAAAGAASGQSGAVGTCEACGAHVALDCAKEHALECGRPHVSKKSSGSRLPFSTGGGSGAGGSGKTQKPGDSSAHDYFEGGPCEPLNNFADDTPLIRSEFLNEPPIDAQDLGADPSLGITLEEHDSWSPGVPKELLKTLKEKQIKRQEHIYEFIMTEKHHCQTLIVMQKVFVESMERYFPTLSVSSMFPRLRELTELHTAFLKQLRQKQREQHIVDSIADILLEFFSLDRAQHLRLSYGEFCANHRTALEQFKLWLTSREAPFAEWYKHCLANPLLKKKGIPECILFVTQRLTKYPLLIEPLLKSAREDKLETEKLQHALSLVKGLLFDVDACVAEKELRERQIELFSRMDGKSFAIYKNKPFRKLDVGVETRRRLKFEGLATLMQGRSKMQLVLVMVLTDCLCFLSENSAHKYTFFTPEHKAGVVPLQKLLIREKAGTESRGIYIISSNPAFPEMYELKVQQPKDKNVWIQSIRQAVLECPSTDFIETENLTTEEKLRIGVNKRELIEKIKQKDIEQALLLEEKIILHLSLLKEQKTFGGSAVVVPAASDDGAALGGAGGGGGNLVSAASFLAALGTYRDLVGVDCDTGELWKRVLSNVQNIGQLASSVYTAATGLPVSRSVSSVGEKQSDNYASPTLPKRAETFAGFDERRGNAKNVLMFPCKGGAAGGGGTPTTSQMMTPRLQELEEKREPRSKGNSAAHELIQLSEQQRAALEQAHLKEHNYAALQINHHLHTLLCIISQQMTAIHSLQLQLALYRENPRGTHSAYMHNDQLEELRNLQDRLQEEKTVWLRTRDQQEQDIEDRRQQLEKLNEKMKLEQEDIKQQREQLYRKMELLSNQGLLLSPSTPLMITCPNLSAAGVLASTPATGTLLDDESHEGHEMSTIAAVLGGGEGGLASNTSSGGGGNNTPHTTVDRRKEKWRTASTISKTPPGNLLSATNAPKTNHSNVKQKIPIKLSSLSSGSPLTVSSASGTGTGGGRIDKSPSFNAAASGAAGGGVTQMFPLKLADKQRSALNASTSFSSQQIIPQHSRTGSSPAIIQHPVATTSPPAGGKASSSGGVSRTDSLTAFSYNQSKHHPQQQQHHAAATTTTTPSTNQAKHLRSSSIATTSAIPVTTTSHATTPSSGRARQGPGTANAKGRADEEEIYF